MSNILSAD